MEEETCFKLDDFEWKVLKGAVNTLPFSSEGRQSDRVIFITNSIPVPFGLPTRQGYANHPTLLTSAPLLIPETGRNSLFQRRRSVTARHSGLEGAQRYEELGFIGSQTEEVLTTYLKGDAVPLAQERK